MSNKEYYPKQDSKGYYWQCAYADAIAYHYVIPSYIYGMLYGHAEGPYCQKYYDTYEAAMQDYSHAIEIIERGIKRYGNWKGRERATS